MQTNNDSSEFSLDPTRAFQEPQDPKLTELPDGEQLMRSLEDRVGELQELCKAVGEENEELLADKQQLEEQLKPNTDHLKLIDGPDVLICTLHELKLMALDAMEEKREAPMATDTEIVALAVSKLFPKALSGQGGKGKAAPRPVPTNGNGNPSSSSMNGGGGGQAPEPADRLLPANIRNMQLPLSPQMQLRAKRGDNPS